MSRVRFYSSNYLCRNSLRSFCLLGWFDRSLKFCPGFLVWRKNITLLHFVEVGWWRPRNQFLALLGKPRTRFNSGSPSCVAQTRSLSFSRRKPGGCSPIHVATGVERDGLERCALWTALRAV